MPTDLSGVTLLVSGIAVLISAVVAGLISWRVAGGAAKKSDMATLQDGYKALQLTYGNENTRLNNELEAERNARKAAALDCQQQIHALQDQLTALLTKLPEPGAVLPVKIVAAEVAVPIALGSADALPVKIVHPLPLPMTVAQQIAAAEAAEAAPPPAAK